MSKFDIINIKNQITIIENHIKELELKGINSSFDIELSILETFPLFYSNYPFLIKKMCKKDDYSLIYNILEKLESVEKGESNFQEIEKNLGIELANKYLYPKL